MIGKISWVGGFLVLAVLVWRRFTAQQKANPSSGGKLIPLANPPKKENDSLKPSRIPWRWLRGIVEPLFMVSMVALGLYFGFHYMPADDDDPKVAGRLAVELPGAIADTHNWADLRDVQWAESHDDAHQPSLIFPWSIEAKQPKLNPDTVRIRIAVDFYRELTMPKYPSTTSDSPDIPIEVHLDLPENTEVVGCRSLSSLYDSRVKCGWAERPAPDLASSFAKSIAASMHVPLPKHYYRVNGVVARDCTSLMFVIDVQRVPGLSFVTNRTRATVRLPGLVVIRQTPMPPPSNPAQGILVNDGIAAPGRYTWSQRPLAQTDDSEIWLEALGSNGAPITGVEDELLRIDHSHEFRSGIAFGLAGAALIGLGQSIISSCRARRKAKFNS